MRSCSESFFIKSQHFESTEIYSTCTWMVKLNCPEVASSFQYGLKLGKRSTQTAAGIKTFSLFHLKTKVATPASYVTNVWMKLLWCISCSTVPAGRRQCTVVDRGQCCSTSWEKWWVEEARTGRELWWPLVQRSSLRQQRESEKEESLTFHPSTQKHWTNTAVVIRI